MCWSNTNPTRLKSSTIDDLFQAFRTNLDVPPKEVFVARLEKEVRKQAGAKVEVRLEVDEAE